MKKSRILFKLLVVLIIAAALLIPSTFSWYNHNESKTGNSMSYSRVELPVSAGVVGMATKRYNTEKEHNIKEGLDGGDSSKLYYDAKGNKEYGDVITGETVTKGITHYYGTTFTNTSTAPAYVNLYLKNFTNSPTVKIGTLQPSLTDKGLSSTVHLANKNIIRVYFQCDLANNWNDSNAKKYVVYKTKDGTQSCVEITTQTPTNLSNPYTYKNISNTKTYYVDLAANTTEFYFASDGNNSGFNVSTLTPSIAWYRTQTITNVQSEMCYFLTGVADDTTFNAQYATLDVPGGVSVKTCFDTLTINKNQHAYVTLNKGTNYTGASTTYAVTAGSNITVNGNTGYVTTTNYSGSATITTTIKGSLGDQTTVTTAVSNPATLAGVPVALNVEVPGKTTNENGDEVNGTAEIVWYIDNSATSSDVEFAGIYYTK